MDKELTSILKRFAEILVHGEQVSDEYFECIRVVRMMYSFFLEEKLLSDIISIIHQKRSNATKVQVIQTISILVQNIRDEKALCNVLHSNSLCSLYPLQQPY